MQLEGFFSTGELSPHLRAFKGIFDGVHLKVYLRVYWRVLERHHVFIIIVQAAACSFLNLFASVHYLWLILVQVHEFSLQHVPSCIFAQTH